ncbi:hypothetical protein [Paenibacillus apiarius]
MRTIYQIENEMIENDVTPETIDDEIAQLKKEIGEYLGMESGELV